MRLRFFILLLTLTGCVSTSPPKDGMVFVPPDVWIGATNVEGFDAAINAAPEKATLQLLNTNGLYWTRGYLEVDGDPMLKAHQTLVVNGATIKVDRTFYTHTNSRPDIARRNITIIRSLADGVRVLGPGTLDANCDGTEHVTQIGLYLGGSNVRADQIDVVNISGSWPDGQESFPFCMGSSDFYGEGYSTNALLTRCRVFNCQGTYVSAITLQGRGAMADHCSVVFPNVTNRSQGYFQGLLAAGTYGATFNACTVSNGVTACYGDTGHEQNLAYVGCTFWNVFTGVCIQKSYTQEEWIEGFAFKGNSIFITTNVAGYMKSAMRVVNECDGAPLYRNIRLLNNSVRYTAPVPAGYTNFYGNPAAVTIWTANPAGTNMASVTISGNAWPADWGVQLKCLGLTMTNNYDLNRKPISVPLISQTP
jgi:hypothetical protein